MNKIFVFIIGLTLISVTYSIQNCKTLNGGGDKCTECYFGFTPDVEGNATSCTCTNAGAQTLTDNEGNPTCDRPITGCTTPNSLGGCFQCSGSKAPLNPTSGSCDNCDTTVIQLNGGTGQQYCVDIIHYCENYSSPTLCIQCSGSKIPKTNKENKSFCATTDIDDCAKYDTITRCWECTTPTKAVNSSYQCAFCEEGKEVHPCKNTHKKCVAPIANCELYEEDGVGCERCAEGQYRARSKDRGFICVPTDSQIENCSKYDTLTTCYECRSSYAPSSDATTCDLCSGDSKQVKYINPLFVCIDLIQECSTYNTDKTCASCLGGKVAKIDSNDANVCAIHIDGCAKYRALDLSKCQTCDEGLTENGDRSKCECPSGQTAVTFATGITACQAQGINGCVVYTDATHCQECGSSMTPNDDNTQCNCNEGTFAKTDKNGNTICATTDIEHCLVYEDNYRCFECGSGTSTNASNTQCRCNYSMLDLQAGGQVCGNSISSCVDYLSATQCATCEGKLVPNASKSECVQEGDTPLGETGAPGEEDPNQPGGSDPSLGTLNSFCVALFVIIFTALY